jgi:hypothetical protein
VPAPRDGRPGEWCGAAAAAAATLPHQELDAAVHAAQGEQGVG